MKVVAVSNKHLWYSDGEMIKRYTKGYQDILDTQSRVKTPFNGVRQSSFNNIPYGYDDEGNCV
jgi:hypothetical protein